MILVGNALIGLLLAGTCGAVLLAKMRPPLEEELVKRSRAICNDTAHDVQFSATVSDAVAARHRLTELVREPSARVDGAWLVVEGEQVLAEWRRDPAGSDPPGLMATGTLGAITQDIVEAGGHRYAAVGCPVEAIGDIDALSAVPGQGGSVNAGRLVLLIDTEEISATVRRGFVSALWLVCLAILLAIGLQLAIALSVIARLNEGTRQLRDAQLRLVKADKLAAVGTLSAGVAHEINNPLAYVIANLECLSAAFAGPDLPRDPADVADLREALAEARQGAERVRVIVFDLKALARGDEEKIAPVDVRAVAESSINIAMNEIKHRARLVREFGAVSQVDANDVRLGQVLLNLLINAAHAVPVGATGNNEIKVVTRMAPDGRVAIEIHDTGTGIPAANLPRLFEPFFTTKAVGKGTGLGLWVCHDIVQSLGGEIVVESEVGKGTMFRVLLPPSKLPAPAPVAPLMLPGRPARATVLVVDDEPMVSRSIERLLGPQHDVVSSLRARGALERIASGERFDAILCDVMMPEMTGIEFYDELARTQPELAAKLVFITGGAFSEGAAEALARICNARLAKPFTAASLLKAVDDVLRAADSQSDSPRSAAREETAPSVRSPLTCP